jgi:hypothetical protein
MRRATQRVVAQVGETHEAHALLVERADPIHVVCNWLAPLHPKQRGEPSPAQRRGQVSLVAHELGPPSSLSASPLQPFDLKQRAGPSVLARCLRPPLQEGERVERVYERGSLRHDRKALQAHARLRQARKVNMAAT